MAILSSCSVDSIMISGVEAIGRSKHEFRVVRSEAVVGNDGANQGLRSREACFPEALVFVEVARDDEPTRALLLIFCRLKSPNSRG